MTDEVCNVEMHDGKPCGWQTYKDKNKCIFHLENKSDEEAKIFEIEFKQKFERLEKDKNIKTLDFTGFIFPYIISFRGYTLKKLINFSKAQFNDADFSGTEFNNEADFSNVKFNNATFSDAKFKKVDLSNVEFNNADFSSAEFNNESDFSNVKFNNATFSDTKFKKVDFSKAEFSNADFSGAEFEHADFSSSKFNNDADFSWAKFNNVDFSEALFNNNISLMESEFNNEAYFLGTKFNNKADFSKTKFKNETDIADFSEAQFNYKTDFSEAQFNNVTFSETQFHHEVDFSKAKFRQKAIFFETEFNNADFQGTEFYNNADFSNAQFMSGVSFIDTKFPTDNKFLIKFEYVRFHKQKDVRFQNINLSYVSFLNTDVIEVEFLDEKWAKKGSRLIAIDETNIGNNPRVTYGIAAQLYRRLRRNYEVNYRFAEAGDFFIGEMETRRLDVSTMNENKKIRPIILWFKRNFSLLGLYKHICLYGESYVRPAIWAIIVIVSYPMSMHWLFDATLPQSDDFLYTYLRTSTASFFQMESTYIGERIIGALLLGLLFIALKRQFERKK